MPIVKGFDHRADRLLSGHSATSLRGSLTLGHHCLEISLQAPKMSHLVVDALDVFLKHPLH